MPSAAFVSMPFGQKPDNQDNEWTKLFQYGLKPLEKKIPQAPGYEPVELWRADRTLKSLGLKNQVMKLIDEATFFLGVLTTAQVKTPEGALRLSNPNVLWELGYAEAIGKPIVVLADDDSVGRLPVLAGQPSICPYNHKLVKAAKPNEAETALRKISIDLAPWVTLACEEARRGQTSGTRTKAMTYANRDVVDLAKLISGAGEHVDLLTTNLDYFVTGSFFAKRAEEHPFAGALKNGATVRIVTMDPESVIAEYRAKQLQRGKDVPGYRKELRDSIIQLYDFFGNDSRFHLNIYNDLPLQITTRVDGTIITSIITRGERARKRIQVQFHLHDEGVIESLIGHFQSMFDYSEDVKGVAWVLRHAIDKTESETGRVISVLRSGHQQNEKDSEAPLERTKKPKTRRSS